jgi:hypothetical protein
MSQEENSLQETINLLKTRLEGAEQKIIHNIEDLGALSTNMRKTWQRTSALARRLASDRRTYLIAGGIVIGFLVLRALLGRSESRPQSNRRMPVVVSKPRSLLYELFVMAVQTFVLHYARKLLKDYLDNRSSSTSPPAAP